MKKFDLEQALAGKKVVTRDGREVKQLHFFDVRETMYPLFGVIEGYGVSSWTAEGESYMGLEKAGDLFLAYEKKTVWVNLWEKDGRYMTSLSTYNTKKEATDCYSNYEWIKYLGAYPIEVEL